jgi:cyclophilin family peptidyl-prolyl cis-trans isomerase
VVGIKLDFHYICPKFIICYAIPFSLLFIGLFISACDTDTATYAVIETDYGIMKLELYDSTPKHKENFIKLAKEGYYDGLLFHRVMSGFMIQGGDPNSRDAAPGAPLGAGGPDYKIDAEIGSPHFRGALSGARQPDSVNPEKKSSGSQFFIVDGSPQAEANLRAVEQQKGIRYSDAQIQKYMNVGGYPSLDNEYTVFGEVVEGFEVIDKIAELPKDARNRPNQDVRMKVRILD